MKRQIILGVMTVAAISVCHAAATEAGLFARFTSPLAAVRNDALRATRQERIDKITELIAIVEYSGSVNYDGGGKANAIHLLSEYRAPEAVRTLTKHLAFLPVNTSGIFLEPMQTQQYYPCARALVKIGEPSGVTDAMIRTIYDSTHDETANRAKARELACWVLLSIHGKDQAQGLLEAELKRPNNPTSTAQLTAAVAYLKDYKMSIAIPQELRGPFVRLPRDEEIIKEQLEREKAK